MAKDAMIGKIIAGKLKIVSVLGEGGVGVVYLAEHKILERLFAIKVLRRELTSDPIAVERFHREAKAAGRLQHRNIVYISDFGQLPDGRFFLVMEHVPGKCLADEVSREGFLSVKRACRILLQIAEALDYAHSQGVAHRDLKPENIILSEESGITHAVKILDFGLAKILFGKSTPITFRGQMFGTPEFMAPEQILGAEMDHRVDIYALGVLTYELLTGSPPFTGSVMDILAAHRKETPKKPSMVNTSIEIPSSINRLVLKAMEKAVQNRFSSAKEMAEIYRRVITQEKVTHEKVRVYKTETERVEKDGTHEAREEKRRALYTFAQSLQDRHPGGTALIRRLALCREREEMLRACKAETTFMKERMEGIQASCIRRESRLEQAILDLENEARRLKTANNIAEQNDETKNETALKETTLQIESLTARLQETKEKRLSKLEMLEKELQQCIQEQTKLQEELNSLDETLMEAVSKLNPTP